MANLPKLLQMVEHASSSPRINSYARILRYFQTLKKTGRSSSSFRLTWSQFKRRTCMAQTISVLIRSR